MPSPVRNLGFQHVALQPFALPDGVVSILNGKLRQRRWSALGKSFVQRSQLSYEYTHGPAIADDVVYGNQEPIVFRSELNQMSPQQRSLREIERPLALALSPTLCFSFTFILIKCTEIYHR